MSGRTTGYAWPFRAEISGWNQLRICPASIDGRPMDERQRSSGVGANGPLQDDNQRFWLSGAGGRG